MYRVHPSHTHGHANSHTHSHTQAQKTQSHKQSHKHTHNRWPEHRVPLSPALAARSRRLRPCTRPNTPGCTFTRHGADAPHRTLPAAHAATQGAKLECRMWGNGAGAEGVLSAEADTSGRENAHGAHLHANHVSHYRVTGFSGHLYTNTNKPDKNNNTIRSRHSQTEQRCDAIQHLVEQ